AYATTVPSRKPSAGQQQVAAKTNTAERATRVRRQAVVVRYRTLALIGPDVTGGDSPNVGGHAYKIPAQLCYENSAQDANGYLINFNADLCYAAAGPAALPPSNGK
ncbi:MAG: hypothetical protein WCC59_02335, partial [Terriglobales bacterium]